MPNTLKQQFSVTVGAGASVVFPHTLNVDGIAVKPDVISFDRLNTGLDIVPANVTTTTFQVDNSTIAPITANVLLEAWHTIERQFGHGVVSFGVGLTPQPFVIRDGGGSGGGGGTVQVFQYTVTGFEPSLSDFFVPLPLARANDTYLIQATQGDAVDIVGMQFPNTLVGDRTTTQFRLIASTRFTAGDTIMFIVEDPT